MASRESQRLFVAFWPDHETRQEIVAVQQQVMRRSGLVTGAVDAANLHLTIQFLGGTRTADIEALKARLAMVDVTPMQILLDTWGHFSRPGILWIGPAEPEAALLDCHASVCSATSGYGQPRRERDYRPHVTLFRKVRHLPVVESLEPVPWFVDRFVLVASVTHPDGVKYRVLDAFGH